MVQLAEQCDTFEVDTTAFQHRDEFASALLAAMSSKVDLLRKNAEINKLKRGDIALVAAVTRLPSGELRANILTPATGWFTMVAEDGTANAACVKDRVAVVLKDEELRRMLPLQLGIKYEELQDDGTTAPPAPAPAAPAAPAPAAPAPAAAAMPPARCPSPKRKRKKKKKTMTTTTRRRKGLDP